jgi:hypothetical protein
METLASGYKLCLNWTMETLAAGYKLCLNHAELIFACYPVELLLLLHERPKV